jgi:hypothetical protein
MEQTHEEVASALRELISAVVIHPAGKEEPKIEVTGRLAQLTSAPARNVGSSAQRQEDQLGSSCV